MSENINLNSTATNISKLLSHTVPSCFVNLNDRHLNNLSGLYRLSVPSEEKAV